MQPHGQAGKLSSLSIDADCPRSADAVRGYAKRKPALPPLLGADRVEHEKPPTIV